MADVSSVEVNREEIDALLVLVRARHGELERAMQRLGEIEASDSTRLSVKRDLVPQMELYEDLLLKLEGAAKEFSRG